MEESIIAGNKIIADFAEASFFIVRKDDPSLFMADDNWKSVEFHSYKEAEKYRKEKDLPDLYEVIYPNDYHLDWNVLMPVYKKCYDTWIQFHKNNQRCADIFQDIWQALWKCNIEECHSGIVEFIEWYNKEQSVKESDTSKAT